MPVRSMTGFGRAAGQDEEAAWSWEIRTVNNRGLDIRLRLPQGFETLELRLRDALAKQIKRGSCTVSLALKTDFSTADFRLNETMLVKLVALVERAQEITGRGETVPLEAILGMKGVIETSEGAASYDESSHITDALLKSFQSALCEVNLTRQSEGERLQTILLEKLEEIESLTRDGEVSPERTPDAIAARLRNQIQRLMNENAGFDEARLYQEAVLIATKADVEEEIKRLYAHVAAARELLAADTPIGRRLEFLAQEFQREANTLCSKSNAMEITRIGLRLKTSIDQFREQVQNVE